MGLLERIQSLLREREITSQLTDNTLSVYVKTPPIGSKLRFLEDSGFLKAFLFIPLFTPDYRRAAMAEALCRANFGLHAGCFEMDWNDGELRFRYSIPILDAELTDKQLCRVILAVWDTAARYTVAFAEVAVSEIEPEVAIARAEASWQEQAREADVLRP